MLFKDRFVNKKVLFIPIYSMRDYCTGKYNLAADGNMARIISKVNELVLCDISVLYPINCINFGQATRPAHADINWIACDAYGTNAKETRNEVDKFLKYITDEYDYIISEPNYLTDCLLDMGLNVIYWCVASVTSEMCPWFVEDFIEIDMKIASRTTTAVCVKNQVNILGPKAYVETFYCPEVFDYKTIFFPFRLSDKSYDFENFKKIVYNLRNKGYNNFKILYTDPNQSCTEDLDADIFVKIPSDKDVYLSILKSKPIIPYFEDSNNMVHISIYEFMYYECKVIMYENDNIDFRSAIKIKDISEVEEKLIRILKERA